MKTASLHITKEKLEELYVDQGLSFREVGKALGLPGSAQWYLKKHGIEGRTGHKGRLFDHVCEFCGEIYQSGIKHTRFCSGKCRNRAAAAQRTAKHRAKYRKDNIGKRHGKLTVYHIVFTKKGRNLFCCSCDCGGQKVSYSNNLISGRNLSCGCLRHRNGSDSPVWVDRVVRYCAECGAERPVLSSQKDLYEKVFCKVEKGKDCRATWMAKNTPKGEDSPKWIHRVKRPCAECGKLWDVLPSQKDMYEKIFCKDTDCRSRWISKNLRGKNNPNYHGGSPVQRKIGHRISAGIRKSLIKGKDGYSWEKLLGYTRKELFQHLTQTMPGGYTWDDISDLHIDHIIPVTAFNFDSYDDLDFKRCWALKNLRLCPAKNNMQKGAKLDRHFQPYLKLKVMQRSGKTINKAA